MIGRETYVPQPWMLAAGTGSQDGSKMLQVESKQDPVAFARRSLDVAHYQHLFVMAVAAPQSPLEVSTSHFLGWLMNGSQALSGGNRGDGSSHQGTVSSLGLVSFSQMSKVRTPGLGKVQSSQEQ